MHPLLRLRGLMQKGQSITGIVLELSGTSAVVSTRYGAKTLDVPTGLQLVAGDRVRVESNSITGKLRSEAQIPVFRI